MGVRSKEPDPGKKLAAATWFYQPVERGTRQKAFLAGHPFGVEVHEDNGSKACVTEMTDGALPCKYCGVGHETVWRGYTPIYTEHYLWRFVIITQEYREYVQELPLGSLIRLSRGNSKHDPVVIRQDPWRSLPLPPDVERSKPIDIVPSLLRCWKIPELTKWHLDHPNPPTVTPQRRTPADIPPAIAERVSSPPPKTEAEINAQLDVVMGRLRHNGKSLRRGESNVNGKSHPPPEEQ